MTSTIDMVDRFSSLPNELLDIIFDHTYTSSPPAAPLSKRFLPFHRIHLYRSIHLSSPQQLESLLETIQSQSGYGTLVQSLSLPTSKSADGTETKSTRTLKKLLPLLPNVDQLDATEFDQIPTVAQSIGCIERLASTLTVLAVSTPETSEGFLDLRSFYDLLSQLHFLVKLDMHRWEIYDNYDVMPKPGTALPAIKTLEIHGRGSDDPSASELVASLPSVTDLTLHSTYLGHTSWSFIISELPPTLTSLSLFADHDEFLPVGSFSTSLGTLRRIRLDRYCFMPSVCRILRNLILLEEIHLGDGPIDAEDFLSLVVGPSRLLHLKKLTLDLDDASFGSCISIDGIEIALEENEDGETEWQQPEYLAEGSLDPVSLGQLIELARSSGIRVEGTVLKALQVVKLHCIDSNNRAILAYSGPSDLRRLHEIRMEALRDDYQFPELDFDSLDRDKLEIVEAKLEESNWSVFGFKEKEQ